MQELKYIYPEFEYLKVKTSETGTDCRNNKDETVQVDELLKITNIDKKKKLVNFQNIRTKRQTTLTYGCRATFIPLLNCQRYSLAEIKATFGFPARVRFMNDRGDIRGNTTLGRVSKNMLSRLGEGFLLKETMETSFISTTVGGELDDKRCLVLPKNVPVNFAVAARLIKGDGGYEEVVRTLHTSFKVTKLADFDQLNVYQHLNAVTKCDYASVDNMAIVPRPPVELEGALPTLPSKSVEKVENPTLSTRHRPKLHK